MISLGKNVSQVTKDIVELCKDNDIIQKLSAGKIFASFVDPEVIRNYVNQTDRIVYLDTPIVLYLLCFYYQDVNYSNPYYQAAKNLIEFYEKYNNLTFLLYKSYLPEISFHFKEALLLIPYDENGFIDDLGGTNNVFYNFYLIVVIVMSIIDS